MHAVYGLLIWPNSQTASNSEFCQIIALADQSRTCLRCCDVFLQQEACQQLHRQERGAKRLYQHSRDCFHQLKRAQQAACLPARRVSSSDKAERDETQAEPSVLPTPRADVEAQVQAAVYQPRQPRPSSPIKGEIVVQSIGSLFAEYLCSSRNCHIRVTVFICCFT